ncbi:Protein of unknown function DUF262 [Amycolatopsis marina]|uniref:GmrSD restriction endonucleases N-terminal domain-containing protein n=1 Tax=Amycolatopsis marina TaxID=490629 RepID=A0A1I0VZU8_9PSEU|nr:DUF262 domain-containing protein [Amycolatopsis marina]SFA81587.1 Protein of unknown function DUF262 [Amycolatopsis marina]
MTNKGYSLDISTLKNSSVQYIHNRSGEIEMDPDYQRQGEIWSVEKQQLLIDSLINDFDVPKIYFHQFPSPRRIHGELKRWALIDGRQRLEAIFGFLENRFPLGSEFVYLADESTDAAGKTYSELTTSHPFLISNLNAANLDIVVIRTSDLELIEEMFSRLNEAMPLNAAEKRNALGGPLPRAVRSLVEHQFFEEKLPFTNRRYRHFDLAAKFLYWTDRHKDPIQTVGAADTIPHIRDTKKVRLDAFFKEIKKLGLAGERRTEKDVEDCKKILDILSEVFVDSDSLLSSIGMVSVYYLLAEARSMRGEQFPSRSELRAFESARRIRRAQNDDELHPGEYEMLEFARLSQSPNDGSALTFRLKILDTWFSEREKGRDPMVALGELFKNEE